MIQWRRFLLTTLAVTGALFGDQLNLSKPISELKLTDGRTLRNVTVVTLAGSYAMAKWDGGRGTLAYSVFPKELMDAFDELRPKPPSPPAPSLPSPAKDVTPAVVSPPVIRKLTGQVYIITRVGPHRFAGANVAAYPASILDDVEHVQRELRGANPQADKQGAEATAWIEALQGHQPLAVAQSDRDGKYVLNIPGEEEVLLFCYCTRPVGVKTEHNIWAVKTQGTGMLDLTNRNVR